MRWMMFFILHKELNIGWIIGILALASIDYYFDFMIINAANVTSYNYIA